ncbi:MAG: hypothetical protein F2813_00720 [Actinobacteria bacterium]|uniref:Unannotated protein n=1 Tax=freshwater metagenome TaxID=449393 RepID=A0A6J5Z321_9ZZZZ|nr:hypothetical protein [Actinomycetota bacterium]
MNGPLTVTGKALAPDYDTVLAHEHLAIDIRCWLDQSHAPSAHLRDELVTEANADEIRANPFACSDNLLLDDHLLIAEELSALAGEGRTLVVDVTPESVGRDIGKIAALSREAQLDVVFGCGPYIGESRPEDGPEKTAAHYRDAILAQFDGPQPRPAVIGEIGTGDPILSVEAEALRGAAMAQARVGAALYVHLHPFARRGHEALDIVEAAGGNLRRTVLCHLDPQIEGGLDYHRELMDRGATISFDLWGDDFDYGDVAMPTDGQRIDALVALVDGGYGDRIVHSHDVCTKTQLLRFGGAGYAHIPRKVAGMMAAAGLSSDEIRRQLAGNALALVKPEGEMP